jgi:thiol peroxidase
MVSFSGCNSPAPHMTDNTDETVTFKGAPYALTGVMLNVGDDAPEVVVMTKDLQEKKLGGASSGTQVIAVVPSIDTPVCDLETRTFNEKVSKLGNVDLTVVSMDLPFAAGRFCAAKGIDNITVASDFRNKEFSRKYGVLISSGVLEGITARAIFVIKDGKIVYKELVPEITNEPNYDAALKAI